MKSLSILLICLLSSVTVTAGPTPPVDERLYAIIAEASAARIEQDIRTLVGFGTRHTLSETNSDVRGIGAARRWIKSEFDRISANCGQCLEVSFQRNTVTRGEHERIVKDVEVVNVIAIQRGTEFPNRYVIMSGDIDSRITDINNFTDDSPGANDNASGMAGVMEAARMLSSYTFPASIVYAGLSGEEQGLFGGKFLAQTAQAEGWEIIGVLNNDMIGNIAGLDGVIDNQSFRIFSEPTPVTETDEQRKQRRIYGGEVDGISRQLARYIHRQTTTYLPRMQPMLIYRLDRFGRGGHHIPFNDAGYAAVRIMETHEHYHRQHEDVRVENGIAYGDVIDKVDFAYAADLTAVNAITLAGLAWAPPAPVNVKIDGMVAADTTLSWEKADATNLAGYRVYWRETTAPQWRYSRFVGDVSSYVLKGIVIDNYLFGVAAVGNEGNESLVVFPGSVIRPAD